MGKTTLSSVLGIVVPLILATILCVTMGSVGITVIAFPTMTGLGYVTLVSPLFVLILLSKVSGIPLLEKQADQRWESDPEYVHYKSVTPVLFPNPFKNLAK